MSLHQAISYLISTDTHSTAAQCLLPEHPPSTTISHLSLGGQPADSTTISFPSFTLMAESRLFPLNMLHFFRCCLTDPIIGHLRRKKTKQTKSFIETHSVAYYLEGKIVPTATRRSSQWFHSSAWLCLSRHGRASASHAGLHCTSLRLQITQDAERR